MHHKSTNNQGCSSHPHQSCLLKKLFLTQNMICNYNKNYPVRCIYTQFKYWVAKPPGDTYALVPFAFVDRTFCKAYSSAADMYLCLPFELKALGVILKMWTLIFWSVILGIIVEPSYFVKGLSWCTYCTCSEPQIVLPVHLLPK